MIRRRKNQRNPLGRYPFGSRLKAFHHDDEYFIELTPEYRLQMEKYCRKAYTLMKMLNLPTNPKHLERKHIKILAAAGIWASEHDRHMTLSRLRIFLKWARFN